MCSPRPLRTLTSLILIAVSFPTSTNIRLGDYMSLLSHTSRRIRRYMAAKQIFNVERFFQALGDNTRLRILNLIGDQEICVCYFVEILGGPQPKISRHLA